MGLNIKWVVGVLRGGDEMREYGDEYSRTATVHVVNDTAYIEGAVVNQGEITRQDWAELKALLIPEGVTTIEFERLKNGKLLKRQYRI